MSVVCGVDDPLQSLSETTEVGMNNVVDLFVKLCVRCRRHPWMLGKGGLCHACSGK